MNGLRRLMPRGYRLADWLMAWLAPLCLLWLLEGFSRGDAGSVSSWAVSQPLLFGMNYALYAAPCLLLCLIPSRRARLCGLLALGLICALLGIVNRYKIFYRMEPLLFSDVTQLADARQAAAGLSLDIDYVEIIIVAGVFAVLFAAAGIGMRGRSRCGALLPLLGALLLAVLPPLSTFALANGRERYDMVDQARTDGTLFTAIAMENHRRSLMRGVNYDEQAVRDAYRALMEEAPKAAADDPPNIIVILSESFAHEAWLRQYLDLDGELTPFYNQLTESCRRGRLYVPKLGGGTSETEFEVLTGLRSQYVVNPYSMGLPPVSSLASVLRDRGYEATAIHWYNGVYYNRYANLRMLGFDSFFTLDTTVTPFEKKGMFVSDEEHYRAILHQLSQTEGRDFIFCLTMQNHGGYDYDDFRVTYGAQTPFSNPLSERATVILTNYCWLIRESDAALEAFIAQLSRLEEPTVVVFFSDHIPPLGSDVYGEIGVSATGDAGHLTPYFIWSNDGSIAPGETNLYSWQLGAYALELAGMNDDPFLSYVERLREATGDVAPEELTAAAESEPVYDLLSYDALFANQYAYNEGGLSPENEDFQIGGKMTLEGFDAVEIAGEVYFRPRLAVFDQAYLLEINGVLREMGRVAAGSREELTLRCVLTVGDKRYNESNALVYAGAQELLASSTPMTYDAYPLWETDFELVQSSWLQGCEIYKSADAYPVAGGTALLSGDTHWEKQPTYGLTQAWQYGVDEGGHIWLSLSKSDLSGAQDPAALLEALGATLYAFKP